MVLIDFILVLGVKDKGNEKLDIMHKIFTLSFLINSLMKKV